MGEMRNEYKILVREPEGKRPVGENKSNERILKGKKRVKVELSLCFF
jgi:hypothetical protein